MNLGAFSLSLAVKDLAASKAFYEKLGFTKKGGDESQNWLVLKNGKHVVGLFQGMFENNIMTFNPGWDQEGKETETFTDVRKIQSELKAKGVELIAEADVTTKGPAHVILQDPDGNQIMIDQHR